MVLYKKKNNDLAPIDNALDRFLLMFAFNYPFVAFIANDPAAIARVPPILRSGVNAVATVLLIGTIVLGIGWLGRQIQRAALRKPLNVGVGHVSERCGGWDSNPHVRSDNAF